MDPAKTESKLRTGMSTIALFLFYDMAHYWGLPPLLFQEQIAFYARLPGTFHDHPPRRRHSQTFSPFRCASLRLFCACTSPVHCLCCTACVQLRRLVRGPSKSYQKKFPVSGKHQPAATKFCTGTCMGPRQSRTFLRRKTCNGMPTDVQLPLETDWLLLQQRVRV